MIVTTQENLFQNAKMYFDLAKSDIIVVASSNKEEYCILSKREYEKLKSLAEEMENK